MKNSLLDLKMLLVRSSMECGYDTGTMLEIVTDVLAGWGDLGVSDEDMRAYGLDPEDERMDWEAESLLYRRGPEEGP